MLNVDDVALWGDVARVDFVQVDGCLLGLLSLNFFCSKLRFPNLVVGRIHAVILVGFDRSDRLDQPRPSWAFCFGFCMVLNVFLGRRTIDP